MGKSLSGGAMFVLLAAWASASAIPGFSAAPLATPAGAFPGAQARGTSNEIFYSDFGGKIGRIASDGTVIEMDIPSPPEGGWRPSGLAFGPDGALWFLVTRTVGGAEETRMARWEAPGPGFSTYPLPSPGGGGGRVIVGPDGKIWYAQTGTSRIGRVDLSGFVTEIALTGGSSPNDLTAGPDGAVWVALEAGRIARISPDGAVADFLVPSSSSGAARPSRIIEGPDSRLFFTDPGTNAVWSATTAGAFTRYPIPTASSEPYGLAATGGFVYFTERGPDAIGRLDPATGSIEESALPPAGARQFPHEITLAFPLPAPRPADTFIVNSPLLFRADVPASSSPSGPRLRLGLLIEDEEGKPIATAPAPEAPFRVEVTVENEGESSSTLDLVVSLALPKDGEVVEAGSCSLSGESTLLCPFRSPIPAGARGSFSVVLRFRAGARAGAPISALIFGGGDPTTPRAAIAVFGRALRVGASAPPAILGGRH